jgi:fermentation-respiration switch protein FrsA (DUF1100 family)
MAAADPTAARPRLRSRLWRLLRLVLIGYVGVLILLVAFERRFIYYPVPAAASWHEPPDPTIRDVTLRAATGEAIHAWWLPRPGSADVMLYSHGNAGNLSHRGPGVVRWSEQLDASVLIYDYPGYGKSEGVPSEPGCHAAARAAFDWLTREQKYEPGRVILFGASLGGAMAAQLAANHDHRALILVAPFTSIPDMAAVRFPWLPARYFVRHKFDNFANLPRCRRPVVIVHGTADSIVPYRHAERLYEVANEPKMLIPVKGADHNMSLPDDFFPRLREFLSQHACP